MESTDRAVLDAVRRDVLGNEYLETSPAEAMEAIRQTWKALGSGRGVARGTRAT